MSTVRPERSARRIVCCAFQELVLQQRFRLARTIRWASPLIDTIASPTFNPAAAAGEPASTRVTTAGWSALRLDEKAVQLAAGTPGRYTAACSAAAATRLLGFVARAVLGKCHGPRPIGFTAVAAAVEEAADAAERQANHEAGAARSASAKNGSLYLRV